MVIVIICIGFLGFLFFVFGFVVFLVCVNFKVLIGSSEDFFLLVNKFICVYGNIVEYVLMFVIFMLYLGMIILLLWVVLMMIVVMVSCYVFVVGLFIGFMDKVNLLCFLGVFGIYVVGVVLVIVVFFMVL